MFALLLVEDQIAKRSRLVTSNDSDDGDTSTRPPSMVTRNDDSEVEVFLKQSLTEGDFTTLSYDLRLLANDDVILEDL